jgi:multiple sugar transport system permease protein
MFMRYEFLRPDRRSFVGLANIIEWAQDPRVLETFWVSVQFFLLYVISSTLLALLVALALDRVARAYLATLYRTIFYLPVVLPAGIIFIVWTWIYDPTWGVMNTMGQVAPRPGHGSDLAGFNECLASHGSDHDPVFGGAE